jgi:2-polyprenyl-3-methyl-5-hydroxy-6-metoxy-1,4-benzoquinol methylase
MKEVVLDHSAPESWQLSHHYDRLEIYGDRSHQGYTYAYQNRQQRTLAAVQAVAPLGAQVLDIAAAQGNFSLILAELGYEVTWNDLRAELADYVSLKHEHGTIHYAPGNAFEVKFEQLFDVVLITEVIEHMAHPDQFLTQVAALVKPGGYVIMTTPNGEYFRNPLPKFSDCPDPSVFEAVQFQPDADGHIFLLHTDEIFPLVQPSGLVIREVQLFTNPLTAGHIKLEPLLKLLPQGWVNWVESLTAASPKKLSHKVNAHMLVVFQRG